MTTIYLHQSGSEPVAAAIGYTTTNPPPVAILAGWLKIANVTNQTAAQLRAALKTGKPVALGSAWLKWHEE